MSLAAGQNRPALLSPPALSSPSLEVTAVHPVTTAFPNAQRSDRTQ